MDTQYFTLGRSGLRVSRLALGTMTFGPDWGWGADEKTSRALFHRYLEAGGNFFDTADGYTGGTSERLLGSFIHDAGVRDRAIVATKFTFNMETGNPNAGGNQRKNIMRAVEASLKRLGTDYIDLYQLHVWDRVTPVEEVMRTLDDLVRSGKVRHVGFSDVPAWYASRAQTLAEWRGWEPLCSLQLEYSLVERHIEHEFVTLGQQLGMGIVVWSPLASGMLSGKYRPDGGGEGRLTAMKDSRLERFSERQWKIVAALEKASRNLGRSMAQIAINWAATRPGVASVILGATKVAQLEDNLGALDFELPAEIRAELDAASRPAPQFPYSFFEQGMQSRLHGSVAVGDKPDGYHTPVRIRRPNGAEPA